MKHTPVLLEEVVSAFAPLQNGLIIDATVGLGGHANVLLERLNIRLIGFDRDKQNLEHAKKTLAPFGERVTLIHDSYAQLSTYVNEPIDGILFDLGFSSVHVDDPERGFSFAKPGPLDMRYDTRQEMTAQMVVNQLSKDDLATLLRTLGEEPMAARIAKAIVEARRKERITTTTQLAEIVSTVAPRRGKRHPATRTFQALRMAVNAELEELEQGLQSACEALRTDGFLAVITFHSLEDRVVKRFIQGKEELCPVIKKPVKPSLSEIHINPRSRSAKLRIARKC